MEDRIRIKRKVEFHIKAGIQLFLAFDWSYDADEGDEELIWYNWAR